MKTVQNLEKFSPIIYPKKIQNFFACIIINSYEKQYDIIFQPLHGNVERRYCVTDDIA